jgi:dTDP-4-amino-4,6-dideoxygalactose transaminase
MKVPFLDLSLQHRAIRSEALAALTATYDATRFLSRQGRRGFRAVFAATLGYPRALAMNSGTAPLHVACMIAGFGPGDEVIAPPFTFISTVWGVSYVGATPVFADVEEGTFNLDPARSRRPSRRAPRASSSCICSGSRPAWMKSSPSRASTGST